VAGGWWLVAGGWWLVVRYLVKYGGDWMKKLLWVMVFTAVFVTAVLTACGGGGDAGGGEAAANVQKYLQAKVEGDETTIRSLLCSEMEQVADREIHTFDGVQDVTIEGMACAVETSDEETSAEASSGRVTCTGVIKALYGTEQTEFQLTNYRVVQEDGEWKWCGETP
jgi:hypothetical protein